MKIIGISGGAGAGKSTFAELLKKEYLLRFKTVSIIHLDSYYYTDDIQGHYIIAKSSKKRFLDMNHPGSVDVASVQKVINQTSTDFLIIEGLFPLCIPSISKQLDLSIYIDVAADIRLGRKIIRKLEEQQTLPEIVFRNYLDTVRDRHFEFIEPCKDMADLVLDGTIANSENIEVCLKRLAI